MSSMRQPIRSEVGIFRVIHKFVNQVVSLVYAIRCLTLSIMVAPYRHFLGYPSVTQYSQDNKADPWFLCLRTSSDHSK